MSSNTDVVRDVEWNRNTSLELPFSEDPCGRWCLWQWQSPGAEGGGSLRLRGLKKPPIPQGEGEDPLWAAMAVAWVEALLGTGQEGLATPLSSSPGVKLHFQG